MARTVPCGDPRDREDAIGAAVRAAKNGHLLALPAEHGYVLAADAFSATGVAALRRAKDLGPTTSLGVLVSQPGGAAGICAQLSPAALDLIAAFWPGQLGLVVRTQRTLQWTVPTDRCVVRMPLHPVLLAVVAGVGPMVYSAATQQERDLAHLILDSGPRPPGPGSTVVDVTNDPPVLLREGVVSLERVRSVVPATGTAA